MGSICKKTEYEQYSCEVIRQDTLTEEGDINPLFNNPIIQRYKSGAKINKLARGFLARKNFKKILLLMRLQTKGRNKTLIHYTQFLPYSMLSQVIKLRKKLEGEILFNSIQAQIEEEQKNGYSIKCFEMEKYYDSTLYYDGCINRESIEYHGKGFLVRFNNRKHEQLMSSFQFQLTNEEENFEVEDEKLESSSNEIKLETKNSSNKNLPRFRGFTIDLPKSYDVINDNKTQSRSPNQTKRKETFEQKQITSKISDKKVKSDSKINKLIDKIKILNHKNTNIDNIFGNTIKLATLSTTDILLIEFGIYKNGQLIHGVRIFNEHDYYIGSFVSDAEEYIKASTQHINIAGSQISDISTVSLKPVNNDNSHPFHCQVFDINKNEDQFTKHLSTQITGTGLYKCKKYIIFDSERKPNYVELEDKTFSLAFKGKLLNGEFSFGELEIADISENEVIEENEGVATGNSYQLEKSNINITTELNPKFTLSLNYTGPFKEGMTSGKGKLNINIIKKNKRYSTSIEGVFDNGALNGYAEISFPLGHSYFGEVKNNNLDGRGVFVWNSIQAYDQRFEGEFLNDAKFFGKYSFKYESLKCFTDVLTSREINIIIIEGSFQDNLPSNDCSLYINKVVKSENGKKVKHSVTTNYEDLILKANFYRGKIQRLINKNKNNLKMYSDFEFVDKMVMGNLKRETPLDAYPFKLLEVKGRIKPFDLNSSQK